MSPLISILVIMVMALAYIESQYATDQDVYQSAYKDNSEDFCDPPLQRKFCESSVFGWRPILKDNNVLDDVEDEEDAPKYVELLNDDFYKKISQKRGNHPVKRKNDLNCDIEKRHVYLGDDYFPHIISNISCTHTGDFQNNNRICLSGSNCRPVIHQVRVLKRRHLYDSLHEVQQDIPPELRACWKFVYIPIEVGCTCTRSD